MLEINKKSSKKLRVQRFPMCMVSNPDQKMVLFRVPVAESKRDIFACQLGTYTNSDCRHRLQSIAFVRTWYLQSSKIKRAK